MEKNISCSGSRKLLMRSLEKLFLFTKEDIGRIGKMEHGKIA